MSGVIIDVETNSEKAENGLRSLNKRLADMVTMSGRAGQSLDKVNADRFKDLSKNINQANNSFKAFGGSGSSSLKAIAADTTALRANINLLKGSVLSIAAVFAATKGVSAFTQAGDDILAIRDRLKLVTKDTYELTLRQRELFKTAQDTRTALGANADIFVTFTTALKGANVEQGRIVKLNRTIQQSAALSGSSVQGVEAALTQLSQGIGSGVLRGEEFNSVMEQMRYLGNGLADALGVSVGGLRKMANEGQLTTEVLVGALEKMASTAERDFGRTQASATVGFRQFRQSLNYFLGDINQFTGASAKLGSIFVSMGKGLDSDAVVTRLTTIRRALNNYFDELERLRKVKFEIWRFDPGDGSVEAEMKKESKKQLEALKSFFSGNDVDVPQNLIERLKSRLKMPTKEDTGFFDVGDTRATVKAVVDTFAQLARGVELTAHNIKRSMPVIIAPMVRFRDSLLADSAITAKAADTYVYKALLPLTRGLEEFRDVISFGNLGDNFGPRAFVRLFQSDDIVDFAHNLTVLNNVFDQHFIRLNSLGHFLNEKTRFVKSFTVWPVQDLLIQLGLMDNRLIRIRDTRFDRVIEYMRLLGDSAAYTYKQLLAPDINLFVYKLKISLLIALKTVADIFSSAFNFDNGQAFGKALVRGIVAGVSFIGKALAEVFEKGVDLDRYSRDLGKQFVYVIAGVLATIPGFVAGAFTGISQEIYAQLAAVDYDSVFDGLKSAAGKGVEFVVKMFTDILSYANQHLKAVENRITGFGQHVKDVFFNIWDEVVGHSFWPDMVDDVNAYTKNLFQSSSMIDRFSDGVLGAFRSTLDKVRSYFSKFGGALGEISVVVTNIDWGSTARNIAGSFGAILYSAFTLLRSKNASFKFLAAAYLLSIFDNATGGAINKAAPAVGSAAGVLGAEFAKGLITSFKEAIILAGKALPSFLETMFTDLIPFIQYPMNLISNFIPIFNNGVLGSLALVTAAYLKFTGKKFTDVWATLFGTPAKGKKEATAGIGPALFESLAGPVVGQAQRVKFTSSLATQLFDKPKFAAIAAGIMSLGLMDAFRFRDAFAVAAPFLAMAILGNKGGARFMKETTILGTNLLVKSFGDIAKNMAKLVLPTSAYEKLTKWLAAPFDAMEARSKKVKGPVGRAMAGFTDNIKQVVANIEAGRKLYADGVIGMKDLFFGADVVGPQGPQRPTANTSFGTAFQRVKTAVGDYKIDPASKSIREYAAQMRTLYNKVALDLVARLTVSNTIVADGFKNFTAKAFEALKGSISSFYSFLGPVFNGLGKLLQNRMLLLSVGVNLAAFFATSASAATGAADAFSSMGDSLAGTAVAVVALTAAMKTLSLGTKAFGAYRSARKSFLSDATADELKDMKLRFSERKLEAVNAFKNTPKADRQEAFGTDKISVYRGRISKESNEAFEAKRKALMADAIPAANQAAWQAAKAEAGRFFTGVTAGFAKLRTAFAFDKIKGAVAGSALGKGVEAAGDATGVFDKVKAFSGAFKGDAAAKVMSGVKEMGVLKTLMLPFRLGLKGLGGATQLLFRGLSLLTTEVLGIALGPLALVAGGLTLLATAFVGFVGPFDSFTDNVKWLADKVLGFAGFEPKTGAGKSKGMADDYGKLEVDGQTYDLTRQLMNMDAANMSAAQLDGVKQALDTYKDTLKSLNDEAVKQGGANDDQRLRASQAYDEAKGIIARQKLRKDADPGNDFGDKLALAQQRRGQGDTSLGGNISRLFGGADANIANAGNSVFSLYYDARDKVVDAFRDITKAATWFATAVGVAIAGTVMPALTALDNWISDSAVGRFFGGIRKGIKDGFVATRDRVMDRDNANGRMYNDFETNFTRDAVKYFDKLPKTVQESLTKAQSEYDKAVTKAEYTRKVVESGGFDRSQGDRTREDAVKRYKSELAYLARIEESYKKIGLAAGAMGKNIDLADKLKDKLKGFETRTKGLGAGLAPDSFYGTEKDMKRFDALAKIRGMADTGVDRARNMGERNRAFSWKKSAEEEAKGYKAILDQRVLFGTLMKQQSDASGVGEDLLRGFRLSGSEASKSFDAVTKRYLELKNALDNAPSEATPEYLRRLQKQLGDTQLQMAKLGPVDVSFEGLNKGLTDVGAAGISMEMYANLPTDDVMQLGEALKDVKVAQVEANQALLDYEEGKTGIEAVQDAIQGVIDKFGEAKRAAAKARFDALGSIATLGLSGVAGADVAASITGDKPNARIRANKGKATRFTQLSISKADAEYTVAQYQPKLRTGTLSASEVKTYSDALSRAADIDEQMQKLGEAPKAEKKDRYGFKQLLADVNEAGIAISDLGFARLGKDARSSLSSIAAQIHGIEKELEKATPTQDVSDQLTRKAKLLADMRQKLVSAFDSTGKAIGETLDQAGLSDRSAISAMSLGNLRELIDLSKQVALLKAKVDDASSLEEYLTLSKELAGVERQRAGTLDKLNNTANKVAETINGAFGSSLQQLTVDNLGDSMVDSFNRAALKVQARIRDLAAQGKNAFAWMREVKRQGEYLDFFSSFATNLEDAIARGAKTGLSKIKDVFPNIGMTVRQFNRLRPDEKNARVKEAMSFDALQKAAELPDLTPTLAKVLDKFDGTNATSVLGEFKDQYLLEFQKSFDDATAQPLELNTNATAENTKAVIALTAAVGVGAGVQMPNLPMGNDLFAKMVPVTLDSESGNKRYGRNGKLLRSSAGALGEMQVLPSTARKPGYGVAPAKDGSPDELARVGRDLLKAFLTKYKDPAKAWAAYNAGPGSLEKAMAKGGDNYLKYMPKETQAYVAKNLRKLGKAKVTPTVNEVLPPDVEVQANALPPKERGYVSDGFYRASERAAKAGYGDLIQQDVYRAADGKQKAKLIGMADQVRALQQAIEDAETVGAPTDELSAKLRRAQESMASFSEHVMDLGHTFREMGERVAQSLDGSLRDGLTAALTGKGDFIKTLFSNLTNSLITNAVDMITKPLTGDNGIVTRFLRGKGNEADAAGFNPLSFLGIGKKKDASLREGDMPGFEIANGTLGSMFGFGGGSAFDSSGLNKSVFGKGGDLLGGDVMGGIGDGATIFSDTFNADIGTLTKDLSGVFEKGAGGIGEALKGLGGGGGGGMIGGAMAAGTLFGTMFAKLFLANGGDVKGPGTSRSDSIPAMLSDGEFVVNAESTKKHRKLLGAINSGKRLKFADGGFVTQLSSQSNAVSDMAVGMMAVPTSATIDESKMPTPKDGGKTEINLGITGDINRQTRATIFELMPQIAAGVNAHNKERGGG